MNRDGAPARAEIMQRFTKIPVQVTAGVHEIAITFIERARAATEDHIFGFQPYGGFSYTGEMRVPRLIGDVGVEGPFGADGPVAHGEPRQDLRLHARVGRPTSAPAPSASRESLATRAFRRPASAGRSSRA